MKFYIVAISFVLLISCKDEPIILAPCVYASLADEVQGKYYGSVRAGTLGTLVDSNYIVNVSILNDSTILMNGKDFVNVEIELANYETQITGRFGSTGFFFYGKENQCIDIHIGPAFVDFDFFECRLGLC